jgi:hypothetical protein
MRHGSICPNCGRTLYRKTSVKGAVYRSEAKTQAFLDTLAAAGGPSLEELSVQEARAEATRAQAADVTKLPADVEDDPGRAKRRKSIRIVAGWLYH